MGDEGANAKNGIPELPKGMKGGMVARGALNVVSGAIPFAGGLLAAAAGAWSEQEQERVNSFLHHWMQMLAAEMKEKEETILHRRANDARR